MSLKVLYSSSKVLFWDILVIITLSKLDPTLSRMEITLMSKLDLITMDPERGENEKLPQKSKLGPVIVGFIKK